MVAGIPNVARVLSRNEVEYMMFTAGKYKRTITPFSEPTEEAKAKFQDEIEARARRVLPQRAFFKKRDRNTRVKIQSSLARARSPRDASREETTRTQSFPRRCTALSRITSRRIALGP